MKATDCALLRFKERRANFDFTRFAFHERISGGNTEIEKNKQQLVKRVRTRSVGGGARSAVGWRAVRVGFASVPPVGRGVRVRFGAYLCLSTTRAAFRPAAPMTPPPG
jgi:hypothetical protein